MTPEVLWQPAPDARDRTRIGQWLEWLEDDRGLRFAGYDDVWRWSVDDLEGFWDSVWDYFGLGGHRGGAVLGSRTMPGAEWFPGTTLNYAEHVLSRAPDDVAVVARSQTRGPTELTGAELREQVARARAGLQRLGVGRGDRVVAYAPNIPETLVVFLATASVGAVFSSCPPEFGARAVLDRFSQIEPRVLVTIDGYRHKGKDVDRRGVVDEIRAGLPTLEAVITISYLGGEGTWEEFLGGDAAPAFDAVPFAHPLYVLYSSGTTGLPKPIVHGHGGVLLEHVKMLGLHHDLGPGDRFFWFSTTGWMMWNYMVSALAVGASIVTFDGDPGHPDLDTLWSLAAETGITAFGVSAPFLLACRKEGLQPGRDHDLTRVRQVGSTGAPLPAEGFRWVYDAVGRDLMLVSASGGTDVVTAFVAGVPLLPVVAGEITCRCLGAKVEAFDATGASVVGVQGNLVITEPLPSMPVGFWGDADGMRYRAAYFEEYPGVWCHGDWITITDRGSCVITGRSDATLNRGGVRLGTSDFYSVVEAMPEVADSLVVHLEDDEGGPGELLLFVRPAPGCEVDDALRTRIGTALRTGLSPRHVPDEVIAVPLVPRTLSGKKLEIPVKRILLGTSASEAAAVGALTDPSALDVFERLAHARRGVTLVLSGLAVAAGAVAQAVTGLGFSLVSAPFLVALEGPRDGVRLNLVLSVLVNLVLLVPQRGHVRQRDAVRLLVPAAIATPLAAWATRDTDSDVLLIVAGALTLVSVLALWAGVRVRRSSATAAGALSGVMNTVAGIGGPIIAIHALNEDWPTDERRATFQLYFLVLNLVAIVVLGPKWPSPVLLAGLAVGWLVGRRIAPHVSERTARTATLVVAAAGSLVAIGRGFL